MEKRGGREGEEEKWRDKIGIKTQVMVVFVW
jgi:hypothetical protein